MKVSDMEKEIEEMEKVFSNPVEEKPEEGDETATEEGEVTEETEEVGEEEHDTEVQEELTEETTDSTNPDEEEVKKEKKAREDWKKRFTKYKAATDATIHQLRVDLAGSYEQNSGLFKRVQSLVEEVRTLQESISEKESIFSDEERDVLGDDAINAITKANKSLIEKQVRPLREELKKRDEESVRERELRAAQEAARAYEEFKQRLSLQVKDLDEINVDPKFAEWLNDVEPLSGVQRMTLFRRAEASADVTRVASFFNEFANRSNPKNILEKKITPTGKKSASTTQGSKPNTKIWTTTQIDQFMNDQIRGVYKGKESLEKEMQAEIDLAISQGRVRKG